MARRRGPIVQRARMHATQGMARGLRCDAVQAARQGEMKIEESFADSPEGQHDRRSNKQQIQHQTERDTGEEQQYADGRGQSRSCRKQEAESAQTEVG
jgi:hypothetical protein